MVQSVEPNVRTRAEEWLKAAGVDYKLEQESLNDSIDKALRDYPSKTDGGGGNRPDAKLLLQDKRGKYWPVMIEFKGYQDKLVKLNKAGHVAYFTEDAKYDFASINAYAVNGAVHYANAILRYTTYKDIISIGITGYKDESGKLQTLIGVYYVGKNSYGEAQKVADFSDLSFLSAKNFDAFITDQVLTINLSPEDLEAIKRQREHDIESSLRRLNLDIYQNEKGLGENDRVYLVSASIIANLGVEDPQTEKYVIYPLEKDGLNSSTEEGSRDGDIMLRKIEAFFKKKNIPEDKKDLICRQLANTIATENINRPVNGESQLKRVFSKIIDDLGLYYRIGLTTDFTGKLFNEMYGWLGFTQDKLNDVVLTPQYVATLLVRLARVNKDSYVWDFATGSAGLLVAAMNEMLNDAHEKITSPQELAQKNAEIKMNQLLGIEVLPTIYMLAVLNMILMGDGSTNLINKDSLRDFDGKYIFNAQRGEEFPATAFVLNPPYSAAGCGMVFVERALSMMNHGYAAIIIQSSAGNGKAKNFNIKILKHSKLIASIKMPIDIFIGKSSVQTYVYVFQVGEAHEADDTVRFINFSNDGYSRSARRKAKSDVNLRNTDHAVERYQEVVNLVRFGKKKLHYLTEADYYEGTIDPEDGADWNQSAPIDTRPTLADFKKTVGDYLAWEVSNLIKNKAQEDGLGK